MQLALELNVSCSFVPTVLMTRIDKCKQHMLARILLLLPRLMLAAQPVTVSRSISAMSSTMTILLMRTRTMNQCLNSSPLHHPLPLLVQLLHPMLLLMLTLRLLLILPILLLLPLMLLLPLLPRQTLRLQLLPLLLTPIRTLKPLSTNLVFSKNKLL
jgi:hypothetical protein